MTRRRSKRQRAAQLLVRRLGRLPRGQKRFLMASADVLVVMLAVWAAFALRLGDPAPDTKHLLWLLVAAPLVSIPVFSVVGLYRAVVRHMSSQTVVAVLKGVTISALAVAAVALLVGRPGFPRSVLILYWLLTLLGIGAIRFAFRAFVQRALRPRRGHARETVVIYGAGMAGVQVAALLRAGQDYEPVAFVDDDRNLHGSVVHGLPVVGPTHLADLIIDYEVSSLLLAMPALNRRRRREILEGLENLPVHVQTIPQLRDIVTGNARLDEIREVSVEDLLGRDPVAPDQALLKKCVSGKVVLVSGAGGSIGSELCRQILRQAPRRLVLLEMTEYALYCIEKELCAAAQRHGVETELVPVLGSVRDQPRLRHLLSQHRVQTVYHAAAYKHVPMVEGNVIEGVQNNVFGTAAIAAAAAEAGVEVFVLVSTDKAVRPANIMGATKRLAELVVRGQQAARGGTTRFCAVRFGNVLDSSGSVVPLFREQIASGNAVTVTHPEVTRYFMTIPEAAELVIQAGALAEAGDVFVLNMGEPVRIVDLARKMIHLMGYEVRDTDQPDGDVPIIYTGLRPGEKLHEELAHSDELQGTRHPMIMRAAERPVDTVLTGDLLQRLEQVCQAFDEQAVKALLCEEVTGYRPCVEPVLAPDAGVLSAKVHYLTDAARRSAAGEE